MVNHFETLLLNMDGRDFSESGISEPWYIDAGFIPIASVPSGLLKLRRMLFRDDWDVSTKAGAVMSSISVVRGLRDMRPFVDAIDPRCTIRYRCLKSIGDMYRSLPVSVSVIDVPNMKSFASACLSSPALNSKTGVPKFDAMLDDLMPVVKSSHEATQRFAAGVLALSVHLEAIRPLEVRDAGV